ncbi:MAG TPA: hypothetical protein PKW80_15450 [Bacteroidales bacterium]|nr:hypothetical protein [Bacteroidales bacterium]
MKDIFNNPDRALLKTNKFEAGEVLKARSVLSVHACAKSAGRKDLKNEDERRNLKFLEEPLNFSH